MTHVTANSGIYEFVNTSETTLKYLLDIFSLNNHINGGNVKRKLFTGAAITGGSLIIAASPA